jgi:hypothetical protein
MVTLDSVSADAITELRVRDPSIYEVATAQCLHDLGTLRPDNSRG